MRGRHGDRDRRRSRGPRASTSDCAAGRSVTPSRRFVHRNVTRHSTNPITHQAPSTKAIRPCSQAPAASSGFMLSGRKTVPEALAHPLDREERRDGDQPGRQLGDRVDEHAGDELQRHHRHVQDGAGGAGVPDERADRDAEQRAGDHREHEQPGEGQPVRGVRQRHVEDQHARPGSARRPRRRSGPATRINLPMKYAAGRHRRAAQPLQRAVLAVHREAGAHRDERRWRGSRRRSCWPRRPGWR